MEKELMDKEVLCIFDTRQIQRFMFHSNTFRDTVGASDRLTYILPEALFFAASHIDPPLSKEEYDLNNDPDAEVIPWFTDPRIRFQLIFEAAGNALCLFRTGVLAQKVIRKVSRYYLDQAYSLNVTAAVTEKTEHLGRDIFHLYQKLNAIKASPAVSDPLGVLPFVMHEHNTGYPVCGIDPKTGEGYSMASYLRRQEASKRQFLQGMDDIVFTPGIAGQNYAAVIHADGNNLGITIGSILQNTDDYMKGIRMRRRINRNIETVYSSIVERTVQQLKEYQKTVSKEPFEKMFQIIHRAGDDVNILCSSSLAVPFVNFFYANLKGATIWQDSEYFIPLYVCTGIAFVCRGFSFHEAFSHAEECCTSAKTSAKLQRNLRNGLAGNWIDYQVFSRPGGQDLDHLRSTLYISNENVNLLTRPYCLDEEAKGTPYYWPAFVEHCEKLRAMNLSEQELRYMSMVYQMGKPFMRRWISQKQQGGMDYIRDLGEPLYEDGDHEIHATWFDVAEMMEMMRG